MKDIYELLNDVDIDTSKYEKMDINMPETTKKRINKNINKAFKIDNKQKFYKNKKYIASAAGLCMAVLVANGTVANAAASINDFIKFTVEKSTFANSSYEKYKENLDLLASNNGIDVKLNSVAYDGDSLYLGYSIETGKELKDYSNFIEDLSLNINGKEIKGKNEILKDYNIDKEYSIFETEYDRLGKVNKDSIKCKDVVLTKCNLGNEKLDKDLKIEWNINKIGGVEGKWGFKFKASKDELMENTGIFNNVGDYKVTDNFKFKLDKIVCNPLGTTIENTVAVEDNKWNKDPQNDYGKKMQGMGTDLLNDYILVTDSGEELFNLGERVICEKNKENKDVLKRYNNCTSLKKVPSKLTIIPVMNKLADSHKRSYDDMQNFEKIKVSDLKEGMKISQGKDKNIIINSIKTEKNTTPKPEWDTSTKKVENKTTINISFEGLGKEYRFGIFAVGDKEKYINAKEESKKDPESKAKELKVGELEKNNINGGYQYYEKTYALNGSVDYTFEDLTGDNYLFIPKFDDLFTIDMSKAQSFDLKK